MASSKAVILIGGPSKVTSSSTRTRFRPLSLDIPKPLFPIAGRALLWHSIQAASKVDGLHEVILIGFYDDAIIAPFVKAASIDFPNLSIRYMREYQSLGTAGGLYHFRDSILRNNPDQIFVLHADIACNFPLAQLKDFHDRHRGVGTVMGVKVPRETATKFGCIVIDPETQQARHYVEKPESFISDTINGGSSMLSAAAHNGRIYLFDKTIFDEIRVAMETKLRRNADDPTLAQDDQLRLEQDVIAPLAASKKLYVYQALGAWTQIKSAASAIPANTLILASYKTTNPLLLRRRSPTITAENRAHASAMARASKSIKAEIIEPCFIDETAEVDPTAKVGPNVSIGAGVKIGYGCRVKESIILDNTTLDKNAYVINSIISEDCKLGPWSRVEGSSFGDEKQSIAILAKNVSVLREVHVRSCIVLPSKVLSKNSKNEVLL
ncbi:BZ3500_MvSof-1268-A1-R1_Chr1-3g02115 [Microbotryum saponariae]|uniref:mannose-1-phosphate guanylyltransferase n=1 Tax=Microbotryum saponariae TaxID=289078 RepID=A0A2X0MSB3_9BASI|nr:BZ3500_MvSof-1268-A1-R1_Chr1-3g02115 [Microbotryum saponariae]SCZ95424.1 BZ3501_MvSof-1269-A2-R1_Chr1-3g01717 [Microbotryum saponariae]